MGRASLKFSRKILLMPALALLAFSVLLFVNESAGRRNQILMTQIRTGYVPAVMVSREIDRTLQEIERRLQRAVDGEGPQGLAEADILRDRVLQQIESGRTNPAFDPADLDALRSSFVQYYGLLWVRSAETVQHQRSEPPEVTAEAVQAHSREVRDRLDALARRQVDAMDEGFQKAGENQRWSTSAMSIVIGLALVSLVVLSALLIRGVRRTLTTAVEVADRLSRGDLATVIDPTTDDEFGHLLHAMKRMLGYLHDMAAMADKIAGEDPEVPKTHAPGRLASAFDKLAQAEARAHHLIESVGAVVWRRDVQTGRFLFVSYEAAHLLGHPFEQWRENPDFWTERIHPDDRARVAAAGTEAAHQGRQEIEYRMRAADGRIVWLHGFLASIAHGDDTEMLGVFLDITERKRMEQALELRDRQLSEAQQLAGLGTWEWEIALDRFTWSDELSVIFGVAKPPAGFEAFLALVHPEDRAAMETVTARTLRDGGASGVYHRIIRPDGTVRTLYTLGEVVWEGDQPIRVHGTGQDVTEVERTAAALKASEDRYRALFESNPQPMWVHDPQTLRFLAVNDAAIRSYGYSREEFLAMPITEIQAPGAAAAAETAGPAVHRAKDGTRIDADVTAHRVLFGQRHAELVLSQDITERRKLEEQLRQSQKMDAVGRLAGGVAHDFNNLLNVIMGYGELMQRRLTKDSPLQRHSAEIMNAASRAASLTRQLLAFSRKQVLQPRVLDLNLVVTDMEKMLRRLIGEHIELRTALQPGLGAVRADPGQIEQVILNLVVNARDAMVTGGKLILETRAVTLGPAEAAQWTCRPGAYVLLAVTDSGTGIGADTVPHIFEPFFTTKELGKGTGLGLSTVYGIVSQSGGRIEVDSEPGHGTTFKVYLPQEATGVLPQPVPRDETAPAGSETILLIEDEDAVRQITRELLVEAGYEVIDSGSPTEALLLASSCAKPTGLILTDVVMPGMSGRQLAQRLRIMRPFWKVLYISGYADDTIGEDGLLEPGVHFLPKPFTRQELLRKVRDVLDGRDVAA
jgi:two-component system, cell cycle sensor histidine kinase and response regulator CckA